jgi:hypothetical protein
MFGLLRSLQRLPVLRGLWLTRLQVANEVSGRRPTEVQPGLFVGGVATRARWAALRSVGVTHVLSLLAEAPPDPWLADAAAILWLPVSDRHPATPEQLRAGCAFLDAARARGGGVFIYCGSGIGRAPMMYLAWRLRSEPLDIATALTAVQGARPIAGPTLSQRQALDRWVTQRS